MPIGGFAAIFALLVLSTLASGIWLVLRANAVARETDSVHNDIVPGPTRPPGRRTSRESVRLAGLVFGLSCAGLALFIVLYVSGTIEPGWTVNDPTVQRP
ncbi:MAG: hypothetical protein KF730_12710 [Sphingomonas sp.]|uniref:hypothetical protein n=1 Tax=Sphingomonas sp. TaxID=28214 RepID=UPI002600392B|nr:hypothetical protein [Sphingomonas sp.]MBX3565423.1 hypothetical protein [Sphingomonas sp.]